MIRTFLEVKYVEFGLTSSVLVTQSLLTAESTGPLVWVYTHSFGEQDRCSEVGLSFILPGVENTETCPISYTAAQQLLKHCPCKLTFLQTSTLDPGRGAWTVRSFYEKLYPLVLVDLDPAKESVEIPEGLIEVTGDPRYTLEALALAQKVPERTAT